MLGVVSDGVELGTLLLDGDAEAEAAADVVDAAAPVT